MARVIPFEVLQMLAKFKGKVRSLFQKGQHERFKVWNHWKMCPSSFICPLLTSSWSYLSYCGLKCENVDKVWILLSCRSYIWPAIEGLFPHDDLAHVLQFIQMTFCMCSAIYSSHVSCGLASFPDFPLTVYCHCNLHADPALPSLSIHIFPVNL